MKDIGQIPVQEESLNEQIVVMRDDVLGLIDKTKQNKKPDNLPGPDGSHLRVLKELRC